MITDGWPGYCGLEKLGYSTTRTASGLLNPVERTLESYSQGCIGSHRWPNGGLLGTHQGVVDSAHLANYLNEFAFRFNRRRSRGRGMVLYRALELAVLHGAVRCKELVAAKRSRNVPPTPPRASGHPPSLDRPLAIRPWRNSGY